MHGDNAVNDAQHLTRDHRTVGEEKTRLGSKTGDPQAHRLMWKYLIYQQGRTLSHATGPAIGAETPALATERNELLLVAVLAPYPQKSVLKPPALQVVFEFPSHLAFSCQISRKCGVIAR